MASWYGPGFQGRKTANGERFNTYEMTAAHKTLPFNTLVRVTNLNNGVSTVVRINDRGPFVGGRIIDLSNAAKNEIQMGGLAQVMIEIYDPEDEQVTETESSDEESLSPVNLFEEEFPATSKIFVEWKESSTNNGVITDSELNQLFNNSRIRIKVLTRNVEDASTEISQKEVLNFLDVTKKVDFITGYSIEVGIFAEKSRASELIEKLGSMNFNSVFLEEIINDQSTTYKVFAGNYKTPSDTKEDLVKLLNIYYNQKAKIVRIGK
ncbi:MAG: septal ring lytic transglycosylase RlpA family protein [bacterium]